MVSRLPSELSVSRGAADVALGVLVCHLPRRVTCTPSAEVFGKVEHGAHVSSGWNLGEKKALWKIGT